MRELKFRAWHPEKKQMFSPEEMGVDELTLLPDGRGFINVSSVDTQLSQLIPMIPMQYSGLKDKNGKEIYEGDVVRVEKCNLVDYRETEDGWHETWGDANGKVHYDGSSFVCDAHDVGDLPLDSFEIDRIEVIGNIYEHPELLSPAG